MSAVIHWCFRQRHTFSRATDTVFCRAKRSPDSHSCKKRKFHYKPADDKALCQTRNDSKLAISFHREPCRTPLRIYKCYDILIFFYWTRVSTRTIRVTFIANIVRASGEVCSNLRLSTVIYRVFSKTYSTLPPPETHLAAQQSLGVLLIGLQFNSL